MAYKSIEERNLAKMLTQLIMMRVEHRQNPPKTSREELIYETDYARSWKYVQGYIDRARTRTVGEPDIRPSQQALARSVLNRNRPLSKPQNLADMVGADEILRPVDGEVWEEVKTGQQWRTHVSWVPVPEGSWWDPLLERWIPPPAPLAT